MLKRKVKTTACIASFCTIISMSSLIANAANTTDTKWKGSNVFGKYNFQDPISAWCKDESFTNEARYCYCRYKMDSSSIYVYNQSSLDARVDVFAGSKKSVLATTTAAVNYNNKYAPSLEVYDLMIPKKSERKIYQYIYENIPLGGSYAHVHFKSSNTYGLWSPDCAYEWSYARATK